MSFPPITLKFEDVLSSKGMVRVIKCLAVHGELHISGIVAETKLNHVTVQVHLDYLVSIGFITEKHFGRVRVLVYNTANAKAKQLQELILSWEPHTVTPP